jgi:hypothetical protein
MIEFRATKGKALIKGNKFSIDLEHELVLASVSLDRSKDARICEILNGELDWSLYLRIATQHGVLPLCCQRLMTLAEYQIPPEETTHWKAALQANTQNNFRLAWKLVECVELLEKNGIECIILKGPVFALQAYGDLTLRQYSDLDILIHQIDFTKTYDLLVKSGYTPTLKFDKKQIKFKVRSDNHFSFTRQGDVFEVHWKIVGGGPPNPLPPEPIWEELSFVQVFDKDISCLSPNNTILFTCIHGAKHGWNQLKWIVDLAYLCQSFSEDAWTVILDIAKGKGIFRQVCLGLLLAEDLLGAVLPTRIHELIILDHHAQLLASQVKVNFFDNSSKPSHFDGYKFYMNTREQWQDRLLYIINLIFLPQSIDWLTISLPENLYFLYFLFRPIRLLYSYGRATISALS